MKLEKLLKVSIVILVILTGKSIFAWDVEPIQFHGFSYVDLEFDTTIGKRATKPFMTFRWIFKPRVSLYGMPVSMDVLYSREFGEFARKQDLISIDAAPGQLQYSMPGMLGFFTSIDGIHFGTTVPEFSTLVLSGTPVDGFYMEFSPGKFYLQFASGEIERASRNLTDTLSNQYKRKLIGIRTGFGDISESHFHLNVLKSYDKAVGEILPDSIFYDPPMENIVVGLDFRMPTGNNSTLNTEVEISGITEDSRLEVMDDFPHWFQEIFSPTTSSHIDGAFMADLSFNYTNTSAKVDFKFIGPGYESFGLYSQHNDLLEFGLDFKSRIIRDLLSSDLSVLYQKDNVLDSKDFTTNIKGLYLGINIAPVDFPYTALYNEITSQKVGDDDPYMTYIFGINTGYGYLVSRMNMSSMIDLTYHKADFMDTVRNSQNSASITADQSVVFPFQVSSSIRFNYETRWYVFGESESKIGGDLIGTYYAPHADISLGLNYVNDFDADKYSLIGRIQWALPWELKLETTIGWNSISPDEDKQFDEVRVDFRLTKRW